MATETAAPVVVTGTGRALPQTVRTNDDPVFDYLRTHPVPGQDTFSGYCERRVLSRDEPLAGLMGAAGRAALASAGCEPAEIDLLLGYGSLAEYISPNELARVHAELGLPGSALVLPIADEYTVFNSSLLLAESLIRTGTAQRALIVCGCNWTSVVDYRTPQSVSAGDGAGAAVMVAGLPAAGGGAFRIVDRRRHTVSRYYGGMFVAPDESGATRFTITEAGFAAMGDFIDTEVPAVVAGLLSAQGLRGDQITLLCHQTSQRFLDRWAAAIGPKELLHTLPEYGNMTSASLPVNLDVFAERISTEFVVLLGIGIQWQADALLLRRV